LDAYFFVYPNRVPSVLLLLLPKHAYGNYSFKNDLTNAFYLLLHTCIAFLADLFQFHPDQFCPKFL